MFSNFSYVSLFETLIFWEHVWEYIYFFGHICKFPQISLFPISNLIPLWSENYFFNSLNFMRASISNLLRLVFWILCMIYPRECSIRAWEICVFCSYWVVCSRDVRPNSFTWFFSILADLRPTFYAALKVGYWSLQMLFTSLFNSQFVLHVFGDTTPCMFMIIVPSW